MNIHSVRQQDSQSSSGGCCLGGSLSKIHHLKAGDDHQPDKTVAKRDI